MDRSAWLRLLIGNALGFGLGAAIVVLVLHLRGTLHEAWPAVVAFNYLTRQVKKAVGSSNALNQQVLFRLRAEDPE